MKQKYKDDINKKNKHRKKISYRRKTAQNITMKGQLVSG
jgi:hypothetical protein